MGPPGASCMPLFPRFSRCGEKLRVGQDLLALEAPIDGEEQLKSLHRRPLDAQMGVAPCAPFEPLDVAVGNVHATDVPDASVDNRNLAVVAVVDAAGQLREGDFEEGAHGDSGLLHLLEKPFLDRPAPHVVIEYPYLYPAGRTSQQHLLHPGSQVVVFKDVVLYVNVFAGILQVLQILVELLPAGGENLYPVARVVGHAAQAVAQLDLLFALFAQRQGVDIDNRVVVALAQLAFDASRHHVFGFEILPEENVENQSHHRQKEQNDYPRQALYRVAIVGNDNHNRTQYGDGIYRIDSDIDPIGQGHEGKYRHYKS